MEKRFCDICEAPAVEYVHKARIKEPIGEPYQAYKSDSSGGVQGYWQCKIVVTPVLTFEEHQTGCVGWPDLCASCLRSLLVKLAESVN